MQHTQALHRSILSALAGVLLLVPTTLAATASGDADEVAGAMVSGAATTTQSASTAAPRADGVHAPSLDYPRFTRTSVGWEIDTGGPGVYLDRFAEDGD